MQPTFLNATLKSLSPCLRTKLKQKSMRLAGTTSPALVDLERISSNLRSLNSQHDSGPQQMCASEFARRAAHSGRNLDLCRV